MFSLPLLADEYADRTLRGLTGFAVVVDEFDAESLQAGLNRQDIQTAVELRCRIAGVPISPKYFGYLHIQMIPLQNTVHGLPTGSYAAAIQVEFRQMVSLNRDPTISAYAATWSQMAVMTMSRRDVGSHCRDSVNRLVDEFLNAYLAQNPKIR
jgi:hypothetical protein